MQFSENDANILESILISRRDVRGNHFLKDTIPKEDLIRILKAGLTAPSVGLSQPWDFVLIDDEKIKKEIHNSFLKENEKAKTIFKDKALYPKLKLEGILESPVNLAIFYKDSPEPVLGQTTMKKSGEYSVVCAVQNIWLMARALNIGVGWVSIVNPETIHKILNASESHQLVAYLCLGYVDHFFDQPELEILGWDKRKKLDDCLHTNQFNL